MFEVTLNPDANQHTPAIALNIAPQNHDNPSLLLAPPVFEDKATPKTANSPAHIASASGTLSSQKASQLDSSSAMSQLKPLNVRKRTVSAAAHQSKDAAYLARWQAYIEQFGNDHYPKGLLKKNLQGHLRLLVAVKRDGSLHEVSLRQSSGSTLLDQAAMDIVAKAAPFEPLPPEIADEVEVLEIIRTWQFSGKLSTAG